MGNVRLLKHPPGALRRAAVTRRPAATTTRANERRRAALFLQRSRPVAGRISACAHAQLLHLATFALAALALAALALAGTTGSAVAVRIVLHVDAAIGPLPPTIEPVAEQRAALAARHATRLARTQLATLALAANVARPVGRAAASCGR